MKITSNTSGDYLVASVDGRLDSATAAELEKYCSSLIDGGTIKIVLNLEKVEYISSSGLRVVLASAKKASAAGGKLALCCLTGLVLEVFRISSFDSILPIYPDADAAVKGEA